jgi:hypothetical protein
MGDVLKLVELVLPPPPPRDEYDAASDLSDIVDRLSENPNGLTEAVGELAASAPELSDLMESLRALAADPRLSVLQRLAEDRAGGLGILEEAHRGFKYIDKGDYGFDPEPMELALGLYTPPEPTAEQAEALAKLRELVAACRQAYDVRSAISGPSL